MLNVTDQCRRFRPVLGRGLLVILFAGAACAGPDTVVDVGADGTITPSGGVVADEQYVRPVDEALFAGFAPPDGMTGDALKAAPPAPTINATEAAPESEKNLVGIYLPWIAYGGRCEVDHAISMAGLLLNVQGAGFSAQVTAISQESLVPRARNLAAAIFLRSRLTHMLFVDTDIVFEATDVINMLRMDADVVGGAYRLKSDTFGWSFDGPYEATATPGIYRTQLISTGFTLISRRALLKIAETHPDRWYKNHIPSYEVDDAFDYFPVGTDAKGNYLSEDYGFSQLATSSGIDLLLYGNATLKHIGKTHYVSNLQSATLQVAAARAEGKSKEEATAGFDLSRNQVWSAAGSMQQGA